MQASLFGYLKFFDDLDKTFGRVDMRRINRILMARDMGKDGDTIEEEFLIGRTINGEVQKLAILWSD